MRKWLVIGLLALCSACDFLFEPPMSQAEIKALETRELNVAIDKAYTAAIQALFDLGYVIRHSEKDAGIVVGERQVNSSVWVPGEGNRPGYYRKDVTNYTVTLLLHADRPKRTTVRIKYSIDGETRLDRNKVNAVWTAIDREVMMMAPAPKAKKK